MVGEPFLTRGLGLGARMLEVDDLGIIERFLGMTEEMMSDMSW